MAPDILTVENVFVTIGAREILKGAAIRTETGKVTALLGRNGSGKSTLLRTVFGVQRTHDCDVFYNGKKVRRPYAVNDLIRLLPQRSFIPAGLEIRTFLKQYRVDTGRLFYFFPELQQDDLKTIGESSGGTERLWATLAIIFSPCRFALLDEPFTHIMPLFTERLTAAIHDQKRNKGFIVTDHQYRTVLPLADDWCLMKEGQTLYIRQPDDLVLHGYLNTPM